MPNECDNWVRLTGSASLLEQFEARPFELQTYVPIPQEYTGPQRLDSSSSFSASDWIQANWGTRWIAASISNDEDIHFVRTNGGLEARFLSAWAPPLPFYNTLATQYSGLQVEYEYTEWGIGFCGHGVGSAGGEPNHYNFGTREEMEALNQSRNWHVCIWNPHFADPEDQGGQGRQGEQGEQGEPLP